MTKTYAQLNKEIAALQAVAEKLYAAEKKAAVEKVNELIAKYALSASELKIAGTAAARPASKVAKSRAPVASKSGAAKYSDGLGHAWGGRGPRPGWLRAALEAGRTLESFAASATDSGVPVPLAGTASSSVGAVATKRPAKYSDSKGNSWSGRGSRPRWLQAALKKRGARIEDFLIAPPASPAAASKAAASANVAGIAQTATRKVAAKKSPKSAAAKKTGMVTSRGTQVPAAPKSDGTGAQSKAASKKAVAKSAGRKAPGVVKPGTSATSKAPTSVAAAPARKAAAKTPPAGKTAPGAATKAVAKKGAPAQRVAKNGAKKNGAVKRNAATKTPSKSPPRAAATGNAAPASATPLVDAPVLSAGSVESASSAA